MSLDPHAVLDRLLTAIATADVTTSLDCFTTTVEPVMLGSEQGEGARGVEELQSFFNKVYRKQGTYRFSFPDRSLTTHGDTAWMVAEGKVTEPQHTDSKPYRLVAVFLKAEGEWRMALWDGSEPIAP